jgi:hypothetical protein
MKKILPLALADGIMAKKQLALAKIPPAEFWLKPVVLVLYKYRWLKPTAMKIAWIVLTAFNTFLKY